MARKLLYSDSINETISQLKEFCEPFCDPSNDSGYCEPPCLTFCSIDCPSQVPPPTPSSQPTNHPNKALITTLLVLSIIFVLACFIAAYIKFHSRRTTRTVSRNEVNHGEFIDEDQFPVLDNPIWYIRTIGLQPSVISSITVCKYVKDEGLVEGTECSVCLSEFQENETLRLLPKCSHAFHIPCIDTWLRSHTNCPLCRAPIVSNSASSLSSVEEESDETAAADPGEESRTESGSESESRIVSEDGIHKLRRSVSLDYSSALKISQAVLNIHEANSDENSSERRVRRVGGNQRLSSSCRSSLQTGSSSSLNRSVSCGGKLFMSRYNRNQNNGLPS